MWKCQMPNEKCWNNDKVFQVFASNLLYDGRLLNKPAQNPYESQVEQFFEPQKARMNTCQRQRRADGNNSSNDLFSNST